MAAKGRVARHDMQNHRRHQPVENGQNDLAADLGVGDGQKARGHLDAHLLHALLGDTAADFHHAQGDNEGWQLAIGNQRAVDHADQGTHDQRGGDADDIRPWTRNANRGQQAGGVAVDDHHQHRAHGRHGGADRQIDAARDDDERHAQRHDAHARVVAQDVNPVFAPALQPRAKAGVPEAQRHGLQDDHQHQHAAGGKNGAALPFANKPLDEILFFSRLCHFFRSLLSCRLPGASFPVHSWYRR